MTDITPLTKQTDKTADTPYIYTSPQNESEIEKAEFIEVNKSVTYQKKRNYTLIILFLSIIIAVAIAVTLYFVLQKDDKSSDDIMSPNWPAVASTWPWPGVIDLAWASIIDTNDSLIAVEYGCRYCEDDPESCDWSVGYGGSPDENGETTLDAMIMYGPTHEAAAVAQLRNIKHAVTVAKYIMHYTSHTMLVGQSATNWALNMGFQYEELNGTVSDELYEEFLDNNCQLNSWKNVYNQNISCKPYEPIPFNYSDKYNGIKNNGDDINEYSAYIHDTIGVIGIDANGSMSVATSTNGATFKIPGRVGDSSIIGSGGYVEQGIGGAVATGNGDIMMRFPPSHAAVFYMKQGMNVQEACDQAIHDIAEYYPEASASLVCMDALGNVAGATSGGPFWYTYRDRNVNQSTIVELPWPINDTVI